MHPHPLDEPHSSTIRVICNWKKGIPMKASEAARILGLLAARTPPVIYEEVTIEGVRMLVIIGKDVALHVLAPNFFPLWDNAIAESYGVATETDYFQFITIVKQQVLNLKEEIVPGVTALKALDEYNYLQASATRKG